MPKMTLLKAYDAAQNSKEKVEETSLKKQRKQGVPQGYGGQELRENLLNVLSLTRNQLL